MSELLGFFGLYLGDDQEAGFSYGHPVFFMVIVSLSIPLQGGLKHIQRHCSSYIQ